MTATGTIGQGLRTALIIIFTLLSAVASAGPAEDYAAQKYEDAARGYEAMARQTHDAAAYYDAGNAYYRLGKLGAAVLSWERALRLRPGLLDARHNLEVAHQAIGAKLGKDRVSGGFDNPWWVRAGERFSPALLIILALACDLALFAALLARRGFGRSAARAGLTALAWVAALFLVMSGLLLMARLAHIHDQRDAIVVADEVIMRELPDAKSREMPTLHAGLRVQIVKTVASWARVRLANQVEGWVPDTTVGRIAENGG
jgi:tetratricopeptide (TPR) repeat protein